MAERVFTQTFGVAGAILEKDGKILLVRENTKGHERGKWNQPAGWIDVGENPVAAAIKEVKEETGLDFEPAGLVGIYSVVKDKRELDGNIHHAIKLIFTGRITGGQLISSNDEIMEVKWFDPAEIQGMTGETLRDIDIKKEVNDYFAGKIFPLDIISHTLV